MTNTIRRQSLGAPCAACGCFARKYQIINRKRQRTASLLSMKRNWKTSKTVFINSQTRQQKWL